MRTSAGALNPDFGGRGGAGVRPGRSVGLRLVAPALGAGLALLTLLGGAPALGLVALGLLLAIILVFPVAGVTTLLVIAPTYLVLTPFIPKGIPVAFLLLALTLVAVALRRVVEPRARPFRWQPLDLVAAFVLVNGLIYIPLSGNLKVGVYGYHENLRLFLLYFVVRLLLPARAAERGLLWLTGLTAFGVALYGCVQHFVGYDAVMVRYGLEEALRGYAGLNKAGVQRAYSITISPIQLGLLSMTLALGAAAILARPGRRDAAWRLAPLVFAAAAGAALFSYTRSSWLGIASALGLGFFLVMDARARVALLVAPVAAGWAVARWLPELGERLSRYALTIVSRDPTETSFHYLALVEAARFFWRHKLGVGLGTASFAGDSYGGGVRVWSENAFFLMGIQTGAQGMAGLILFLLLGALAGRRLLRRAGDDVFEGRLGAATLLGLTGFAVSGLSLPVLLDVGAFGPLWVIAALTVNALERRAAEVAA